MWLQVHKSVEGSKLHKRETEQPLLFLETHVSQNMVALEQLSEVKAQIDQQRETLDAIHDVGHTLLTSPSYIRPSV